MNDLVGQQINDWLILSPRPNKRKGFVLAQCVCGKIKEVSGRSIRRHVSKNCGCKKGLKLRNRQRIPGTDSALRAIFSLYRSKARRHEICFELNVNEFKEITSKNCYYCKTTPKNRSQKHKYIYYYNGIDRVDNLKGYVKNNIVPCCEHCNTLKGGVTLDIINKVLDFLKNV